MGTHGNAHGFLWDPMGSRRNPLGHLPMGIQVESHGIPWKPITGTHRCLWRPHIEREREIVEKGAAEAQKEKARKRKELLRKRKEGGNEQRGRADARKNNNGPPQVRSTGCIREIV